MPRRINICIAFFLIVVFFHTFYQCQSFLSDFALNYSLLIYTAETLKITTDVCNGLFYHILFENKLGEKMFYRG